MIAFILIYILGFSLLIIFIVYIKHRFNTLEAEKLREKARTIEPIENLKCQFLMDRYNPFTFKYCNLLLDNNIIFLLGYDKVFGHKINREPIIFYANSISHNFYPYKKYKILKIILRHLIDNGLEITLATARNDEVDNEMIIYGLNDNQRSEIIQKMGF